MKRICQEHQRGSEVIEAAIGIPAFMLFLALIIAGGRVAFAHQAIDAAAADAARSASLARTQSSAVAAASNSGMASLTNQGVQCLRQIIVADTSGFNSPVGTPASVSVTVTCVVDLASISLPGAPGQKTISATATSPLDTYRSRG